MGSGSAAPASSWTRTAATAERNLQPAMTVVSGAHGRIAPAPGSVRRGRWTRSHVAIARCRNAPVPIAVSGGPGASARAAESVRRGSRSPRIAGTAVRSPAAAPTPVSGGTGAVVRAREAVLPTRLALRVVGIAALRSVPAIGTARGGPGAVATTPANVNAMVAPAAQMDATTTTAGHPVAAPVSSATGVGLA